MKTDYQSNNLIKEKKKILFIINPISGVGKQKVVEKLIQQKFDTKKFEIDVIYTEFAQHAIEICNNNKSHYNTIVAVGGDGSVNEIAQCLVNTNTNLAIIPTGSGNGLARHLNIPLNINKAIDTIVKGKSLKIDSVKLNQNYFFCTAGLGFDAFVSWEFSQSSKRGFWSYFKIVLKHFSKYKPHSFKVILSNKTIVLSNKVIVSIANANQYGNNIIISPEAKINDGMARLITIDKFSFLYLPAFVYYLLTKKISKFKYYKEFLDKEFTIFSETNHAHIDGEPININNKINIKVHPQSLNVIVT